MHPSPLLADPAPRPPVGATRVVGRIPAGSLALVFLAALCVIAGGLLLSLRRRQPRPAEGLHAQSAARRAGVGTTTVEVATATQDVIEVADPPPATARSAGAEAHPAGLRRVDPEPVAGADTADEAHLAVAAVATRPEPVGGAVAAVATGPEPMGGAVAAVATGSEPMGGAVVGAATGPEPVARADTTPSKAPAGPTSLVDLVLGYVPATDRRAAAVGPASFAADPEPTAFALVPSVFGSPPAPVTVWDAPPPGVFTPGARWDAAPRFWRDGGSAAAGAVAAPA